MNYSKSNQATSSLPASVRPITIDAMDQLGVDVQTGELYWNGKKVVVQQPITLGTVERLVASSAAAAAVGIFIIELGRSMRWWGG